MNTRKKYDFISYMDVINQGLAVMDTTAVSLCMDNNIPIVVFGLDVPDGIKRVVMGESIGTRDQFSTVKELFREGVICTLNTKR